jgi:lipoate-protein ligase A
VALSSEAGGKDYLRSPVCFETHTPSDLLASDGQKLAGSAQLRRAGGVLQHGAAFLQPYQVQAKDFSQALFDTVAAHYSTTPEAYPLQAIQSLLAQLEAGYLKTSGEILASASTTNGSHLEPASF